MKYIFYLIGFLTLQLQLYSLSLSGTIKSDLPIPFTSISIKGQSIGTSSNSDGFFEINNIKEGSYEFIFSAIGFMQLKKNILIQAEKNTLDVILEPSSYDFDTSYAYGPLQSRRFLIGLSVKL